MPRAPRRRVSPIPQRSPPDPLSTLSRASKRAHSPALSAPPEPTPPTPQAAESSPLDSYPTTPITLILLSGYPSPPTPNVSVTNIHTIPCPRPLTHPHLHPLPASDLAELQLSFLRHLSTAYNDLIIMQAHIQERGCHHCEGGVGELYHHMVPVLAKCEGGTTAMAEKDSGEWKGKVLDVVVPICKGGGECDRLAEVVCRKVVEEGWEKGREDERRRKVREMEESVGVGATEKGEVDGGAVGGVGEIGMVEAIREKDEGVTAGSGRD